MRNPLHLPPAIVLVATLVIPALAAAQDDPVLVENSVVKIRKSDYLLELERLPKDIRPGFANSERRINDLLRRMLLERTLAAQAREEKLDQEPTNAAKLKAEVDRMHTLLKVEKLESDATAEFESKRPQWEVRARELYTVDRAKYATAEKFSASHILFKTDARSPESARKLALEARAKIVAGADFNQLAREISEDGSAKRNFGRLDWFVPAEMDPAFSKAVAALKQPGDISEPVASSFGVHLIKLEGRRPAAQRSYEEVRDEIMAELRQKYVNDARDSAIAKLRNDPTIRPNRAAIEALVIRVDPEARRAAQQVAPGATVPK